MVLKDKALDRGYIPKKLVDTLFSALNASNIVIHQKERGYHSKIEEQSEKFEICV